MSDEVGKAIAAAAADALGPLGFRRKGRSRTWTADHRWWLLNVEFQPSGFQGGQSYLNVGEQHLWIRRDHLVFEAHERAIQGALDLRSPALRPARLERLMSAAVEAVSRRIAAHGEGRPALERLTKMDDPLNAGIALAVIGDTSGALRQLASEGIHERYRGVASRYLATLETGVDQVAEAEIAAAREALGLPQADVAIAALRLPA